MPLAPGTRIGAYEIAALIGAGGMGEVYRATDTNLKRSVAIKVLPDAFASDAERLARFQREAEVLASLNHPNIAAIHGLERGSTTTGLVMELVDGPTLADRIAHGPIPLEEALPIAKQLAEALEAAHERGIVHRDLKPANVKVRSDATVKVLDFGLAKALVGDPLTSPASLTNSPTITSPAGVTGVGVLLGTAAYMSPEQAKGKVVDRRSDVWAFGCVLFEMITGKRAFAGDGVGDTLAAVLRAEPDWSLLPTETDFPVRTLLRGCLEKDARARVGSLSAVLFVLRHQAHGAVKEISFGPPVRGNVRRVGLLTAAALILGAAVAGTGVKWWSRADPPPVVRTAIATSGATAFVQPPLGPGVAITADGSRIVYGGNNQLLVRPLDQLQPTVLSGLGEQPHSGFLSPMGQWVGFFDGISNAPIKKVSITGGSPEPVCAAGEGVPSGATWGPDDTIIFATYGASRGLQRVPASGGEPTAITTVDRSRGEGAHLWPEFLPGGQAVLFTIMPPIPRGDAAQVAVLDLRTGTSKILIGGSHARYAPSGHLVYGVSGTLHAVPFDLERLEVVGRPVRMIEGVATTGLGGVAMAVAANGSLVYVAGSSASESQTIVAVDRNGHSSPLPGIPHDKYRTIRVSPDGTRLALSTYHSVSIYDVARETLIRLATGPTRDLGAIWTPDGQRLIFTSSREGEDFAKLFARRADGTGAVERVLERGKNLVDLASDGWTKDGRLLFSEVQPKIQCAIGQVSLERPSDVTMLVQNEFCNMGASLSPNGRWIAYNRGPNPPGVYVERYPELGDRQFISSAAEDQPVWSRDGRELFFKSPDSRQLLAVPIQSGTALVAGRPQMLFELPMIENAGGVRGFDIMPDGRFVIIRHAQPDGSLAVTPQINFVQNWTEDLKRLVPPN